jgi:predicted membrane-bound spermidine synthase
LNDLASAGPAVRIAVRSAAARRLALMVFFASGFAALVYQVIWQRLLVIFSGADVYSVTIIVAAFMAGLGLGSLGGGRLADRLSPQWNLRVFALAELAVGLFGLASKTLYYDGLYGRFPDLAGALVNAAGRILMATSRPSRVSRAR